MRTLTATETPLQVARYTRPCQSDGVGVERRSSAGCRDKPARQRLEAVGWAGRRAAGTEPHSCHASQAGGTCCARLPCPFPLTKEPLPTPACTSMSLHSVSLHGIRGAQSNAGGVEAQGAAWRINSPWQRPHPPLCSKQGSPPKPKPAPFSHISRQVGRSVRAAGRPAAGVGGQGVGEGGADEGEQGVVIETIGAAWGFGEGRREDYQTGRQAAVAGMQPCWAPARCPHVLQGAHPAPAAVEVQQAEAG